MPSILGDSIRAARQALNLTLKDTVAEILRVSGIKTSTSFLSRLESGKAPLPMETLNVIAQVLKMDSSNLLALKQRTEDDEKQSSVTIPLLGVPPDAAEAAAFYIQIGENCFRLAEWFYGEFRYQDCLNAYKEAEKIFKWFRDQNALNRTCYRIGLTYHNLSLPKNYGVAPPSELTSNLKQSVAYLRRVYDYYLSREMFTEDPSAPPGMSQHADREKLLTASALGISASAHQSLWRVTGEPQFRREAIRLGLKAKAIAEQLTNELKAQPASPVREELLANLLYKTAVLLRELEIETGKSASAPFESSLALFFEAIDIQGGLARQHSNYKNVQELARIHKAVGETMQLREGKDAALAALWQHLLAKELYIHYDPQKNTAAEERVENLVSRVGLEEYNHLQEHVDKLIAGEAFVNLCYPITLDKPAKNDSVLNTMEANAPALKVARGNILVRPKGRHEFKRVVYHRKQQVDLRRSVLNSKKMHQH